jgi:hypothetical protein
MIISVGELVEQMDEVTDDSIIKVKYNGTVLYAQSVEIFEGDVIICADEIDLAEGEE